MNKNNDQPKMRSFRISDEAGELLDQMSLAAGFTKTSFLEMCIIAHAKGIADVSNRVRDEIINATGTRHHRGKL